MTAIAIALEKMAANPHDISERYELVERIAVGGMAEVFRAKKHGSHGFAKQMAVKRILPSLAADEEFVTRFIAEAKIAVTLSHANIVQVFDFSRFGESLYIAMEYVDGADLANLLARLRRSGDSIGVAPGLHVAMELLKGLDFAHRKGVIHRDISPSNILVSRAGEVKIADFGIAQAAGLELTSQHRVMGKWPYMSPEQTRGEELDVRSDLFSAGTVLAELLTGERVFRGKNAEEIVRAIAEREVPPPSSLRPELPKGLDAPILSLLARDPKQRPSAADVLTKLVEVSYESTVQATAASLAGEIERAVPPRRPDDTGSAELLDDIINSELLHARGDEGRRTRVTLEASGIDVEEIGEKTGMTFIKTSVGPGGLAEWVVGDSTGSYQLKRTDRLFALADETPDEHDEHDEDLRDERTIIDATGGVGRAMPSGTVVNPPPVVEPTPSRRRLWPILASVAVVATIAAAIVIQTCGGGASSQRDAAVLAEGSRDAGKAPIADADVAPIVARISLSSTPPGARIFVSGTEVGHTPLTIDHPGADAEIKFRREGFESCLRKAGPPGEGTAIECTLEPSPARLTVLSTPAGASVYIGRKKLGKTPLRDFEIAARPGSTEVTIKKRGYKSASQRVALSAGSSARVRKELEADAEKARVDIYSEPWANVYFRGKKIGVAPVRGLMLPAGKHRLTLVNPVQNRRTTITVTIPGPKRYKVTLPK